MTRAGFHCIGEIDYPSLIRGGHNFYKLRASSRKVHSTSPTIDLLIALNPETVQLHTGEVNPRGGVIHDEKNQVTEQRPDLTYYPVPLTDIVKELGGPDIMRNTVALGAGAALIGLDIEYLKQEVADSFRGRDKIIEINQKALQRGWEYVVEWSYGFGCSLEEGEPPDRLWMTGNEAVALGAVAAGCMFYSAYPMTPASPVLHYLIAHEEDTGMVVNQAESEIAAMLMTVGAAYTGVRAMTGTSGGGFCLMTEGFSLAALTETPIVLHLAQRPGPSTGLATYSGQGDLLFAVYGAHGEFQRIVLAPGDVEECFYMTAEAFNLAERFQVPVIVLTDKNVVESHESTDMFDLNRVVVDRGKMVTEWISEEPFKRYEITRDGVSPRAFPGTPNILVRATSNEHTEQGFTTSDPSPVAIMVDKRFSKAPHIREATEKLEPVKTYGPEDPAVTLVGWGSVKGPALEALKLLEKDGVKARYVHVRVMEPFPAHLGELLDGKCVLVENNRSSQLGSLIQLNTGYHFSNAVNRYDGRSFTPDMIAMKVKEAL